MNCINHPDKEISGACVYCGRLFCPDCLVDLSGKIGTGIIYLFTVGLFGFGWIYDIFRTITGTYTDVAGLPINKG